LPVAELVGFCLVWLALIVLTVGGLRTQRRRSEPSVEVEPVLG
jgi:EamA domain-containing membrane protein RarD